MHIIDSHFHWWPRPVFEKLCKRIGFPSAHVNAKGGYTVRRHEHEAHPLPSWKEWHDLDE